MLTICIPLSLTISENMGRCPVYYTKHDSLDIDTKWLKEHGYLCGFKTGGITWKYSYGWSSSISFTVNTYEDYKKIRFQYVIAKGTENERHLDYSYKMHKVSCNLGGFRWAIECGLSYNNTYCGRKVYKLFQPPNSDYFGCRKCMHIVYESQRKSGSRLEFIDKLFKADKEADKLEKSITKTHYKGTPTKKMKKLQKLRNTLYSNEHPMITLERMLR